MAAGLIRKRLTAAGLGRKVTVRSAGTMAQEGIQASKFAVELMGERGIVLGQHVTHCLTPDDIHAATLILAMAERHRRSIFYMSPESAYKVVLLSELANRYEDIRDPYGFDKDAFAEALGQIEELLEMGWPSLLKKLGLCAEV